MIMTSTQLFQQWHVPRADESDQPVLFEDIKFEKASLEKDQRGMCKRELKRKVEYNPTPYFAREPKKEKIEKLADGQSKSIALI